MAKYAYPAIFEEDKGSIAVVFPDGKEFVVRGTCEGNIGFEENYITYAKYKEYLYRLVSTKKMLEKLNITIETRQDIIDNMENIRKYVRGHNLYDIFYGRYKGEKENEILKAYIDAAPRENFDDIFTAIDNFVYFNNRKN